MSRYRGPYVAAGPCRTGPQPGNRALMSWYLGAYGARGGTNLGIFNCKPIEGTNPPVNSLHGEGRADDLGSPIGNDWAPGLAAWLRDNSAEIGVQLVIYRRQYWSCTHPDIDWQPYGGVNPHVDHMHVELTWQAAGALTVEALNQLANRPAAIAAHGQAVSVGTGTDMYAFAAGTYGPGNVAAGMELLRELNPGLDRLLDWQSPVGYLIPKLIAGRPIRT